MTAADSEAHRRFLDAYYRHVRHVYDPARRLFPFGRDRVLRELVEQPWERLIPLVALSSLGLVGLTLFQASGEMPLSLALFDPKHDLETLAYAPLSASLQEFVFRGALQGSVRYVLGPRRWAAATAVGFATVAYAAMHLPWGLPAARIMIVPGLVWGWQYERDRTLLGVALAHAAGLPVHRRDVAVAGVDGVVTPGPHGHAGTRGVRGVRGRRETTNPRSRPWLKRDLTARPLLSSLRAGARARSGEGWRMRNPVAAFLAAVVLAVGVGGVAHAQYGYDPYGGGMQYQDPYGGGMPYMDGIPYHDPSMYGMPYQDPFMGGMSYTNPYQDQMTRIQADMDRMVAERQQQIDALMESSRRQFAAYYRQETGDQQTPDAQAADLGMALYCQTNAAECRQSVEEWSAISQRGHALRMDSMRDAGRAATEIGKTNSETSDMVHQGWLDRQATIDQGHADVVQGAIHETWTYGDSATGAGYSLPIQPDPQTSYSTPDGQPLSFDYGTGTWYVGDAYGWWQPLQEQRR